MGIYFFSIVILLLGALLSVVIKDDNKKLKSCSICSVLSTILTLIPAIYTIKTGMPLQISIYASPLLGYVDIVIDALSAFFLIVISIMSSLGIIYANGYMKPYLNKGMNISSHCFSLMLLVISMMLVVTAQNALFFLIVWEIMSLSSFFLVIFEGEKKEVISAGIKYLVYMHISMIFILAAMIVLNAQTDSLRFMDYLAFMQNNGAHANLIFVLAFIGFGIKAGFVPFHNWLPEAHPAAPSHVSGIMSGIMIKTGIYGILRFLLLIGTPSKIISYAVLGVAVISALYGVLYAITQHDIKRLLAYHSIENIGIIGIGIGAGMLGLAYDNTFLAVFGFTGGILHILNHSIFKELLFFAAGSTYLKTHTRNIELMGGLIKKMPYTALLFIIGSVAICGIPPFNGFISEFLIYAGMIKGVPASGISLFIVLVLSIAALAMVGTMAMLCFTKASGVMFLGNPRGVDIDNVSEAPATMIFPMTVLAFLTFFIGMYSQYFISYASIPASMFTNGVDAVGDLIYLFDFVGNIGCYFMLFLAIAVVILVIRYVLGIGKKTERHSTWGCGYNRPNNHMQYTASSYADLFISTLKPLFKRVSHIKKPKDLFPKEAYYEQNIEDIEEAYIVKPLIMWDEKFLTKFERIQNGNIQQYILFGLIFLILSVIGMIYFGG